MVTAAGAGLNTLERELVGAIQAGLPLAPRPYAEIADRLGVDEPTVRARVRDLLEAGVIKRLGVVVRHHELGFVSNAMVVWDVPDDRVEAIGRALGEAEGVTLCYRRPRRPPHWPYNLFSMIHGRERESVRAHIEALRAQTPGLRDVAHAVLFSGRRFKQCGARYGEPGLARASVEGHDHG